MTQPPLPAPDASGALDSPRAARLFLLVVALYFLAHVLLRCALGGTFEPDEAEMVILGRGLHLAEGSQTPLYEWTQALSFAVFGLNTLGLMAVKNAWLFGAYAATFAALRRLVPGGLAMAGTLSLLLLPNLGWEAQRSNSHTIAMVTMTCVTLLATLRLIGRRTVANYLWLGLAIGLGGLSKPNYWVVPLALGLAAATLPGARAALLDRRIWLGLGLAALICALPYGKMLAEPEQTFADTWEFSKGEVLIPGLAWINGLLRGLTQSLSALALLGIALAVTLLLTRRRPRRAGEPAARLAEALMLRAALIGLGLAALVVILGNVAFVRARWLLPLYLLLAPALTLPVLRAAGPRARRNFLRFAGLVACLVLVAIADLRLRGAGSDSLEIGLLADRIAAEAGGEAGARVPPILGAHYFTGNLALAHPEWTFLPPYATRRLAVPPPEVLLVDVRDDPKAITRILAEQGWTGPWHIAGRFTASLPYRFEPAGKTRAVEVLRIAPGAA